MDIVSQNIIRAIRFERPEYIPVVFWVNPACWHHYEPEFLSGLMAEHRLLFSDFEQQNEQIPEIAPWESAGAPYTDTWGCVWETTDDGITGTVTRNPLAEWRAFESFAAPEAAESNGIGKIDWSAIRKRIGKAKSEGKYHVGSLEHGHTFQRLSYLRGYENLLLDMTDGRPELSRLIEMVESFNAGIVQRYIEAGSEMICYPEDLGMQRGPMLSPQHFRRYIKPVYENLMRPAREAGRLVHMHSDGDIRDLVDDLLVSGTDVLNLQDLVNGIDWIAANLKGKVCIDIDVDRQQITRFGSPAQIDKLILEEVEKLGGREGGLMMIYGLYPGVPYENVKAIMDAMERYAGFYS
jgi:uroporphyrinogen decarboxylase